MRTGADSGSAELGRKYMKKSISVVTLFPGASQCYAGQIRDLFGPIGGKDNQNGFISGFYGCF